MFMRTLLLTIGGMFALILCYLVGEVFVLTFNLPFPGALAGMLLLLFFLLVNRQVPTAINAGAKPLLNHMIVLFVPAVAGIVLFAGDIKTHWLALSLAIGLSTIVALALSAWVAQRVFALKAGGNDDV
ncbi:CidA/LrgA family protein [Alteromonas lipotrueiana]|uniref:CidA/LrgA family protein n=1 Tax=Alteromonas lipotrueiana TaxID=2803815 RepID=UPI001C44AEA9|nr:CidA/LrgA family protein [Alteromonas lipotrueiana]|tara:strand:+ start:161 stop:544 length:384 start_codon:yes stop_codon:yes gene_type:complete